jgi:glycosyltransferase involved in cell wall biosynthesis
MGRVVIEAYSFGVPVLANSVGGIPEIVRPSITGELVDITNPVDFKIKITKLLAHDYKDLSNHCLYYSKSFSSDAIADSYLCAYKETIEN